MTEKMTENWMEVNKAIAKYGRKIINGSNVKYDKNTGAIYIDINSDCGSLEANVMHRIQALIKENEP